MQNDKKIFCKKFNKEMPALENPPMLGEIGEILFKNVSSDAFNEWLELQIKIINEERLDLSEVSAKERLFNAMISFLNIEDLV